MRQGDGREKEGGVAGQTKYYTNTIRKSVVLYSN